MRRQHIKAANDTAPIGPDDLGRGRFEHRGETRFALQGWNILGLGETVQRLQSKYDYGAFNSARRSPKSNTQLATDYIQVVSRLGEHIEGRLDAKLDVTDAHGSLRKTIVAIRLVLSKFKANQETNFLLHGKAGTAYVAGREIRPRTNQSSRTKISRLTQV